MTVNAWGADDPAPATKGGTGLNTFVAGDIIYASGANTWARLAKGSDGQVLKLASGVPSWAAESGGGGAWTWLASTTAAASSAITFDNTLITSTYDTYAIMFHNVQPVSDADIIMRFSPDNGSTIRTTGYDSDVFGEENTGSVNSTTSIEFSRTSIGGAADEGRLIGMALICNASDSGIKTHVNLWDGYITATNSRQYNYAYGKYGTAEAHNWVQITASTGNIDTGTINLYGLANS
jgi:hypothetical protein